MTLKYQLCNIPWNISYIYYGIYHDKAYCVYHQMTCKLYLQQRMECIVVKAGPQAFNEMQSLIQIILKLLNERVMVNE